MSQHTSATSVSNSTSASTELASPSQSSLPGVNVLLMGPAGTGKTHSLGTAVEAGLEVFYLGLEPGREALAGYFLDKGKPIPDNVHWHTLAAPKASFSELLDSAQKVNQFSLDALAKMQDSNRGKHNQFISLLQALNNFPDDRTGRTFGPVDSWGTGRMLCVDGLTGLGRAAMSLVIGGKPVRSQSDWGIAQDQLEKLVRKLCDDCKCHFTLIAHVERETDAVLGGVKLMPSTLGRALAPKLAPMFSDAILTTRTGSDWAWDTSSAMADVKTRNLPIQANNKPDFATIIRKWQSRGGVIEAIA